MTPRLDRILKQVIALVAVAMSLYHLTIAFTGAPQPLFCRSTHLLFALTLVFLLHPGFSRREGARPSWLGGHHRACAVASPQAGPLLHAPARGL